ncbi:MAG TPA: hypothetical protein VH640_08360 [Bryobacteraceae bacterium]|jgi:hypothetical protein
MILLKYDGPSGYLRSTLSALHIPVESQMVVCSKTSLQRALISPSNPRSIFFNDSVAAAWVPGEPFVEVAVEDPQQGVLFYTLDQKASGPVQFTRQDRCLQCHESNAALGVPGMLVRSEFTAPNGYAMQQLGEFVSDHRSPFEERWGGWYVTGKVGGLRHMGNLMFADSKVAEPVSKVGEISSLDGRFDTTAYLSPYSHVIALMVFDHQMRMMNLFTSSGWEVRSALYDRQKGPTSGTEPPAVATVLREAANEVVDYMLFVDEAPLHGKIEGTSGFAEEFAARQPRDSKGRSLRQFDLERRLMRFPCSYMIYSDAFEGLPAELKHAIYQRMWQILSGQEKAQKYSRLSSPDRQAVVEILRETKQGLPDYFQAISR